nr:unnamed protein product [Digitaria exilis]
MRNQPPSTIQPQLDTGIDELPAAGNLAQALVGVERDQRLGADPSAVGDGGTYRPPYCGHGVARRATPDSRAPCGADELEAVRGQVATWRCRRLDARL